MVPVRTNLRLVLDPDWEALKPDGVAALGQADGAAAIFFGGIVVDVWLFSYHALIVGGGGGWLVGVVV
jgi:hypothetical protein